MRRARHPLVIVAAAIAVVVGAPVAWYLGSPVFLRTELNEPPVVAIEPIGTTPSPPSPATDPDARGDARAAGSAGLTGVVRGRRSPPGRRPPRGPGGSPGPTTSISAAGPRSCARSSRADGWCGWRTSRSGTGPDLYVVLSPDRTGYTDDAIEVGRLRATDGSFNMRVPEGTDVSDVSSVLIWCKQFSHLFAVAPLDG